MSFKWDDGMDDGRMPPLPEQGIKLVADDWENLSAWLALREHAELQPCRYVLSHGSYREADPALLVSSLLARNALLTEVATSAISGMGNAKLLEGKGFWPQADKYNRGVTSFLWKLATDCLGIINLFLVEDEESLQCLYQACERELRNIGDDSDVVRAAQERVRRGLRNARSSALQLLG